MKTLIITVVLMLASAVGFARQADPIVFVFQRQKEPSKVQADADKLAAKLGEIVGRPVKAVVPTDYSATVQALRAGQADFAYLSSMPFLLARRDAGASILVVEQRPDHTGTLRTDYDSIIVVPVDSPLQSIDDLVAKSKDLRFCFTSPTSGSGYIMPYWRLVDMGALKPRQDVRTIFKSVSFGGGYTQALQEVLAGRADVAAVSDYVLEGPNKDVYLKEADRAKLRVLARTSGVPTHLVAAAGRVSPQLRDQMKQALLQISKEDPELLSAVYGAAVFVETDENKHVQRVVEAIEAIGLPIDNIAR
jgi:phosphonate transport system substrate-binding protein